MIGKLNFLAVSGDGELTETVESAHNDARTFFVALYGFRESGITNLNILRQHMFASSKSDLRKLPPTEDTFNFHVPYIKLSGINEHISVSQHYR